MDSNFISNWNWPLKENISHTLEVSDNGLNMLSFLVKFVDSVDIQVYQTTIQSNKLVHNFKIALIQNVQL